MTPHHHSVIGTHAEPMNYSEGGGNEKPDGREPLSQLPLIRVTLLQ